MERRPLTFERAEVEIRDGGDMVDLPGACADSEIVPIHPRLKFAFEMGLEVLSAASQ